MTELASGLTYYIVFLLSTTLHEAAHAWAAMRGGDLTAYHGGQVSFSPLPHMRREPFGMVILPLLSVVVSGWPFGFASAPYDPQWAMRYPRRAAWMALAGPAANLALVLCAFLAIHLGVRAGIFTAPQSVGFGQVVATGAGGVWPALGTLLSICFSLNLLLCIFNLIPLPPLDGSAALPLVLWADATRQYQRFLWGQPTLAWVGIILAWQVFDIVFDPIWLFAVNLIHPDAQYG